MIQRSIFDRIQVWWWDNDRDDWSGYSARYLGWPVPVETDNVEVWDGGGA